MPRKSGKRTTKEAQPKMLHPADQRLPGPPPNPPRDGDKKQARQRINREVATGRRSRPNDLPCTDCGHVWKAGDPRHQYDHHKGYAAVHHYDVEPVCSRCHAARDNLKKKQTHCVNGHEFTPENTSRRSADGTRRCRACNIAYNHKRQAAGYFREWKRKRRNAA